MNTTVIGLFQNANQVSASINELEHEGISPQTMSLIMSENIDKDSFEISSNTKITETAAIGAATGGGLGLIIGGLAAIGSVATGGVGLLASGPVVAALAGGVFGAGGGGMLGAVFGTAIPDSEHQTILDELEKGGALLCVHCQSGEVENIKALLRSQNPIRVEIANAAELNELN